MRCQLEMPLLARCIWFTIMMILLVIMSFSCFLNSNFPGLGHTFTDEVLSAVSATKVGPIWVSKRLIDFLIRQIFLGKKHLIDFV